MSTPLESLISVGTKLWLDSIDPDEIARNRAWGASGATSNPIIIADLIKTGRFDELLTGLIREGVDDHNLAWGLTDYLVRKAQEVFLPVWEATKGDDGYVSFELDPLLEDPERNLADADRAKQYVELAKVWSEEQPNRLIKVPATPGGIMALEEMVAAGVNVNVTLIFSERQFRSARDSVWRGAQKRPARDTFKSVYSIFVSRLDVYTEKHCPDLSPAAQGQVGIINAKRIWRMNKEYWINKRLPLKQEMVFASTGTKKPADAPWKYVEAFAGSDIETNPPATNTAVHECGRKFTRQIHKDPPYEIVAEIQRKVDMEKLENTLMEEGIKKFADPQKALLALIARKRAELEVPAVG